MSDLPKILLVEDDESVRQAIADLLSSEAEVITAADGEECLDKLESTEFDAVLLDILLPKKSGISVLREIREKYPNTPVAVITGYTNLVEQEIREIGVDWIISKPFDYEELKSAVLNLLARRRRERES